MFSLRRVLCLLAVLFTSHFVIFSHAFLGQTTSKKEEEDIAVLVKPLKKV